MSTMQWTQLRLARRACRARQGQRQTGLLHRLQGVAALAMRHEINANQLRRWMRLEHLVQPERAPVALPVVLAPQRCESHPADTAQAARPAFEIEFADAVVRVHPGAEPAQLRMVLQALRARSAFLRARACGWWRATRT